MADCAREPQDRIPLSDFSDIRFKRGQPGLDFAVALEHGGQTVVLTKGIMLVVGEQYPPHMHHALPRGFVWEGAAGEDRTLAVKVAPDPRPSTIEVAGQQLKVGEAYSSVTQQHPLPEGYKWSAMMYGLDHTMKGVNRVLLFAETKE